MTETTNYHLKKPEGNDFVGPGAFNENADLVDAALQGLEEEKLAKDPETGKLPEGMLPPDPTTTKAAPVDADWVALTDTAASNARKKLTWAGVKATLKSYFDNLYAAATHTHAWSVISDKPNSYPPSAHEHAASEITSGILPVARGGTGAADAAGARANLGACADRLTDETAEWLQLTNDPTVNNALKKIPRIRAILKTDILTESTSWTAPDNLASDNVSVRAFGGGGSGGSGDNSNLGGGGGGGGYMATASVPCSPGTSVNVTIGSGGMKQGDGSIGRSGGTTSFGTFVSANGGAPGTADRTGGNGGSGGGGSKGTFSSYTSGGNGGNAAYGGGGGGGAGSYTSIGGTGGTGGTYGGGGGGGGRLSGSSGATGGAGGTYGSAGGTGGYAHGPGRSGQAGTNTTAMALDFTGVGAGGVGGAAGAETNSGGGGGGGGYGGNGGAGASGNASTDNYPGGGGGGGGYGGNGGVSAGCGGSGGGGYGGKGGNGGSDGGGGGGGYGISGTGGSQGVSPNGGIAAGGCGGNVSSTAGNGGSGVCIITYYVNAVEWPGGSV